MPLTNDQIARLAEIERQEQDENSIAKVCKSDGWAKGEGECESCQ